MVLSWYYNPGDCSESFIYLEWADERGQEMLTEF
jgi:hypothetical protein